MIAETDSPDSGSHQQQYRQLLARRKDSANHTYFVCHVEGLIKDTPCEAFNVVASSVVLTTLS